MTVAEKINVSGIVKESIVDGDGLRLVVFEQGCLHNCMGCQNKHTHAFVEKTLMTTDEIVDMVKNNPLLDGITLSGGDPFFQAKANIKLVKQIRKMGLNVWAYTGFTWEDFYQYYKFGTQRNKIEVNDDMIKLLQNIDVLVDGRFELSLKSLETTFRGSTNQRIIDVKKSRWKETPIELNF